MQHPRLPALELLLVGVLLRERGLRGGPRSGTRRHLLLPRPAAALGLLWRLRLWLRGRGLLLLGDGPRHAVEQHRGRMVPHVQPRVRGVPGARAPGGPAVLAFVFHHALRRLGAPLVIGPFLERLEEGVEEGVARGLRVHVRWVGHGRRHGRQRLPLVVRGVRGLVHRGVAAAAEGRAVVQAEHLGRAGAAVGADPRADVPLRQGVGAVDLAVALEAEVRAVRSAVQNRLGVPAEVARGGAADVAARWAPGVRPRAAGPP